MKRRPLMRRRSRIFPLLFAVLALVPLTSCQPAQAEDLRFGLSAMPVTLDPRFATDAASSRINRLLYRRLVDFDGASLPVPSLATWRRISATHYRFLLGKAGRTFQNGLHLGAADVKATYAFILDPRNASPHRISLSVIQRIETPDDDTVDFYLARADPLFPGRLTIGILPRSLMNGAHAFNRAPMGSGPFGFLDWPDEGRLRLRRRRDGAVVEFIHVPDPTVRALKLLRGEIDMLQNDMPPELVTYLAHRKGVYVMRGEGSNFVYLGFNMQDALTGRIEVRRAIAHAIDRRAIIRHVLGGAARPARSLLPPDHWAGNADLAPYTYDPPLARKLLASIGFNAKNPARIVYKTSSDPFRIRLATIIQQQLGEVGIQVDLRSYDWGTFYGDIKAGRFQMYSLIWVGIKLPDIFRYVFHSRSVPPGGANRGRLADTVVDGMIERAEAAPALEEQARDYRRLQAYLLKQLPYVPLWYEDHVFIVRKDIGGYTIARDGNYDGLINVHRR